MKLIIDIADEMVCNDIKYKALEPTTATDEVIIHALYNGVLYEERPKGEWITWEEAGNDIASPNRHECSCCHDSAQVLVNGIELLSDFCPNCGADMRGEEK